MTDAVALLVFGIILVARIWNPDLGRLWGYVRTIPSGGVSPKVKRQLSKNLSALRSAVPAKHQIVREAFIGLSSVDTHDTDTLTKVAYHLCEHCGLQGLSLAVTYKPIHKVGDATVLGFHESNSAGHVVRFGRGRYSIWLNPKFIETPRVIGAILAHEVAHIFSIEKEIQFRTNTGNGALASEQMTDLLAISLGMGKLLADGCSYHRRNFNFEETGTVGYLSPASINFAYGEWRKQSSRGV